MLSTLLPGDVNAQPYDRDEQPQQLDLSDTLGLTFTLRGDALPVVSATHRKELAHLQGHTLVRIDGIMPYSENRWSLASQLRGLAGSAVLLEMRPAGSEDQPTYRVGVLRHLEHVRFTEDQPGLGVMYESSPTGHYAIIGLMPDGPAQKAGAQVGDIIVRVDGLETHRLWRGDFSHLLSGQLGMVKVLEVTRPSHDQPVMLFVHVDILPAAQQQAYYEQVMTHALGPLGNLQIHDQPQPGGMQALGMLLRKLDDGRVEVLARQAGGPAAQAGIGAGDILLAIEGQDAAELSLAQCQALALGPDGQPVTLRWLHPPTMKVTTATLTRQASNLWQWRVLQEDALAVTPTLQRALLPDRLADQHRVARWLEAGDLLPQDNAQAIAWLKTAARQGHATSQHRLRQIGESW